eukprot:1637349-Rhodomonas_salina.1
MAAAGGDRQRRCLYEVLDVERNATPDEIKQAFRKAALKWHPGEKRLSALQLGSAALTWRSDVQTKTLIGWMKRRKCLRRSRMCGTTPSGFLAFATRLRLLMRTSWWQAHSILSDPNERAWYGDNEGGFYAVYRSVFEKIEELEKEDIGSE